MKTFLFILTSLGIVFLLSSCGLISTASADSETRKIGEEYGGIYVFDKKIRDEIIQREKERANLRKDDRFRTKSDKNVKSGNDIYDIYIINSKAIDEALPQVLSNGCKYFVIGSPPDEERRETNLEPYFQKIKEYMGEKAYNKFDLLSVTSYYIDKKGQVIPVSVYTHLNEAVTTYGLYGDEGAGFRLSDTRYRSLAGSNIFYLVNDKFVKSDGEGIWW